MCDAACCADEAARPETGREMNAIVQRIFTAMTASECFPVNVRSEQPADLHARVVFLRSCCKTCEISLTHEDADVLTRLLLGFDGVDLREDVACELCNMVAGGWKSRRSAEGLPIAISTPQVGVQHGAESCANCFSGTYSFRNGQFNVRLRCAETH